MAKKVISKIKTKSLKKAPPQKVKINNHVSVFYRTVQKSEEWVREMHKEMKWMNADGVYHLLRAVLQTLRDQLNIHEAAQLSAQLPLLLRGTFYECWNPKNQARKPLQKEDFLMAVRKNMGPKLDTQFDFESGVLVALKVITKHISPGEIEDVLGSLKPSLRNFIEKSPQEDFTKREFTWTY